MKRFNRRGLAVATAAVVGLGLSLLVLSSADARRGSGIDVTADVDATSQLKGKKNRYHAARAFDGSLRTAWCEGKKGDGVNETLTLVLHEEVSLTKVEVAMGFWKSKKLFKANNRPTKLQVVVAGDVVATLDTKGKRRKARAKLSASGRIIGFKIVSVLPGRMRDTCISEVKLWGKDSRGRSVRIRPEIQTRH